MSHEASIILVHFGDPVVTSRCLEAVDAMDTCATVIVVNNDREDCLEPIQKTVDGLHGGCVYQIIQSKENGGFAAGCNQGITAAREAGARYVWLLNNDANPEKKALSALLQCAGGKTDTLLGSTVVEHDAPQTIQVAGGVAYDPVSTRIEPGHTGKDVSAISTLPTPELDYIYGASMFIPMAAFDAIGTLDEAYFLYYEELDFCTRARQHGLKMGWCRESIVRHIGGRSTGGKRESTSHIAIYHEARSTMIYTRKHHPAKLAAVACIRLAAKPLFLLFRNQFRYISSAVRGTVHGLSHPIN